MRIKNNAWIGFLSGLVAPLITFSIYVKIKFPREDFLSVVNDILQLGVLSPIISLTVFVNLLVFFIFIWSNADRAAKGVLGATFIYAFMVVLLKFTS